MTTTAMKDLRSKFNNLPEHQKIIYVVNGVVYSEFVRISSFYAQFKFPQPIIINNSVIDQNIGHADFFAKVCMSNVVKTDSKPDAEPDKKNLINMKFQSNKDDIKFLNTIKKANAVVIIDDSQNRKYIISDGHCFINLNKCQEDKLPYSPVFKEEEIIFKKEDMSAKSLKGYNQGCKTVVLELYNNTLEYINFNGRTKYSLSTQNIAAYEKKSNELCLYSRNFLKIAGNKNIDLKIAFKDKNYWLIITSELSKNINAITYERLHIARIHTPATDK